MGTKAKGGARGVGTANGGGGWERGIKAVLELEMYRGDGGGSEMGQQAGGGLLGRRSISRGAEAIGDNTATNSPTAYSRFLTKLKS